MRAHGVLVSAILLAFGVFPAARAAEPDMRVRFGVAWVDGLGDTERSGDPFDYGFAPDSSIGYAAGFEYMPWDRIGLEFAAGYSSHDVKLTLSSIATDSTISGTYASFSMLPLAIRANLHVVTTESVDFYIGAEVAYVIYSDLETKAVPELGLPGGESFATRNDIGLGGLVGLDVPLGSGGWRFSSVLSYTSTRLECDEPGCPIDDQFDVDPLALVVGACYGF